MVDFRHYEENGQIETHSGNVDGYGFDLTFANGSIDVVIVDAIGKPRDNQQDFNELKKKVLRAYLQS